MIAASLRSAIGDDPPWKVEGPDRSPTGPELARHYRLTPKEREAVADGVEAMREAVVAPGSGWTGARYFRGRTADEIVTEVAPCPRRGAALLSCVVAYYRDGVEAGLWPPADGRAAERRRVG
jgi:hypothetical protein